MITQMDESEEQQQPPPPASSSSSTAQEQPFESDESEMIDNSADNTVDDSPELAQSSDDRVSEELGCNNEKMYSSLFSSSSG